MSRVRVNPYGISKSAKVLAESLSCKRLLITTSANSGGARTGSRFVAKNTDVIINWGNGKANYRIATGHYPKILNTREAVQLASNKLHTLSTLMTSGIQVPHYLQEQPRAYEGETYMARTTLSGHSGQGIVVGEIGELPGCSLYVEFIDKVAEYRVIAVGNEAVDVKKKMKRRPVSDENPDGYVGEHHPTVWNLDGGYIMARQGFDVTDELKQIGVDSIKALGLDFGAVDIIEDSDGVLYVLEVNTAFGLEGQTIELVSNAIKDMI